MKRPPKRNRLSRSFYDRPPDTVARELLGKALLRHIGDRCVGGLIVETEAYLAVGDLASHSARGKTPSNATMFGRPGTLYVYPIHAKYCMNAVTQSEQTGSAVLIRAIEPIWGIEVMQTNRGQQNIRRLTRGPAMTCQAINVDRSCDGIDLVTDKNLWIAEPTHPLDATIRTTERIGISKSESLKLRFFIGENRFVSRPQYTSRT